MTHRNLDQLAVGLDVQSADVQTVGTVKEMQWHNRSLATP